MSRVDTPKVQTNLKLSARRAAALDIAASLEGKDKAVIVEEALELRERLMGEEYERLLQAALTLRFSDLPEQRLQAIEALREEAPGVTLGGSATMSATRAQLRTRSSQPHDGSSYHERCWRDVERLADRFSPDAESTSLTCL